MRAQGPKGNADNEMDDFFLGEGEGEPGRGGGAGRGAPAADTPLCCAEVVIEMPCTCMHAHPTS